MAYERPTIDQIYNRVRSDMEARLTDGAPIPPISLLGVLVTVIAGAAYLLYGFLDWIYRQIFADTADETGLKRWGAILDVPQGGATYASGTVSFTGTTGTTVPAGSLAQSSSGAQYATAADFIIDTDAAVSVEATEAGAAGNTTDLYLTLTAPIAGVDLSVAVLSGLDNGADTEDFDAWQDRVVQRLQNAPRSGSEADYEREALKVSGVSFAWCYGADRWTGAGSVGLAVSGPGFAQISTSSVEAAIEAWRPAPAVVTYYSPSPVSVDFGISITPNNSDTRAAVAASVADLYASDAEPGATMLISRLRAAVTAGGVSDYQITALTVDGSPVAVGNYTVALDEVPVPGAFSFGSM